MFDILLRSYSKKLRVPLCLKVIVRFLNNVILIIDGGREVTTGFMHEK